MSVEFPIADVLRVWYESTPLPNLIMNHSGAPDASGWAIAGTGAARLSATAFSSIANVLGGGMDIQTGTSSAPSSSGNRFVTTTVDPGVAYTDWAVLTPAGAVTPGEYVVWTVSVGDDPSTNGGVQYRWNVSAHFYDANGLDLGIAAGPTRQLLSSTTEWRLSPIGSTAPILVPAGAATARIRIEATNQAGVPNATAVTFQAARAAIMSSAVAAALPAAPAWTFPSWTEITGTLTVCRVKRGGELDGVVDALDSGSATLSFRGPNVDPLVNTTVRRGRRIVISGGPGFYYDRIFFGQIATVNADYGEDQGTGPAQITITATDPVAPMRGLAAPLIQQGLSSSSSFPFKVADTIRAAELGNYLGDYDIAGGGTRAIVGHVDDWSLWDNLSAIRNSFPASRLAVNRRGVLWYAASDSQMGSSRHNRQSFTFSAAGGAAQSFTDLDLEFGTSSVVNSLSVVMHGDAEVDGEKTYGPYLNRQSIAQWGAVSASVDVVTGTPSAIATAYLQRLSSSTALPRHLTFPVRTGAEAARFVDIYDQARVVLPSRGLDVTTFILGVEHAITPENWDVTITLRPLDTASPGVISNPDAGANTGPSDYEPSADAATTPIGSRTQTAATVIATATDTVVALDTAGELRGMTFNAGTFTIAKAGFYSIAAGVAFKPAAPGSPPGRIEVKVKKGAADLLGGLVPLPAVSEYASASLSGGRRLAVGDTIQLIARQTSGASRTLHPGVWTYLDLVYVGD